MIQATGNTDQDISSIIDELNRLNTNKLSNALQIVSYGVVEGTIPNTPGTTSIASIPHGLNYAPVFLMRLLGGDGFNRDFPYSDALYTYPSGLKDEGGYPYNRFMSYADVKNINIEVDNLTNPGGFVVSGLFAFTYYIFNRPINSGT